MINWGKQKEHSSSKVDSTPPSKVTISSLEGEAVKILPSENVRLLELEARLSSVEMKLFELRKLLLEEDYKHQNKLSRFGKSIKKFSV